LTSHLIYDRFSLTTTKGGSKMGLDMYLSTRKYVSQYDYKDGEREINENFSTLANMSGVEGITKHSGFSGISVSYPVGYWRKDNAIHGWFVNTLGGGVDECQEIHVPRVALVDLLVACKAVLSVSAGVSKQDVADEFGLMPTEGFFFGGYELDEYYDQDIKYTIEMIEHILSLIPEDDYNWEFTYQASW
jgi:hypothetical protein